METVVRGDPELESAYVTAAQRLVARGAVAISSDCGFSIRHQADASGRSLAISEARAYKDMQTISAVPEDNRPNGEVCHDRPLLDEFAGPSVHFCVAQHLVAGAIGLVAFYRVRYQRTQAG